MANKHAPIQAGGMGRGGSGVGAGSAVATSLLAGGVPDIKVVATLGIIGGVLGAVGGYYGSLLGRDFPVQ
jgi:hypothetical protein